MLKLKLQYFGYLMWRTDSFEKTLMLGKIEGRRRRGWQRMRWLDGITNSMDTQVVSNSLRPHKLQHARPPCPSPTPGVHSNSCPSSRWCHPAISSSVIPFSSCPNLTVFKLGLIMPTLRWGLVKLARLNTTVVLVLATQSCPALWDSMDCSLPGSSVCGIIQARYCVGCHLFQL